MSSTTAERQDSDHSADEASTGISRNETKNLAALSAGAAAMESGGIKYVTDSNCRATNFDDYTAAKLKIEKYSTKLYPKIGIEVMLFAKSKDHKGNAKYTADIYNSDGKELLVAGSIESGSRSRVLDALGTKLEEKWEAVRRRRAATLEFRKDSKGNRVMIRRKNN